jgi:hypothetical protein
MAQGQANSRQAGVVLMPMQQSKTTGHYTQQPEKGDFPGHGSQTQIASMSKSIFPDTPIPIKG